MRKIATAVLPAMVKPALVMVLAGALPALAQTPAGDPPQPTETVTATAAPLTDAAIQEFVKTHTAPSQITGKIPRWARGICVRTQGLPSALGDAVTSRIKAVIREIGAPLAPETCDFNAAIFFDARPQEVLDDIAARAPDLLGYHEAAQAKSVATIRHPVQAWYATQTRDLRGVVLHDVPDPSVLCDTVDMDVMSANLPLVGGGRVDFNKYKVALESKAEKCSPRRVTGNRLRDGLTSEFANVTVVASLDTLNKHQLAPVADYIALLMLSQTQAFDTCQKMDSIANLLVPGCDFANSLKGLTAGDLAYLKAIYRADAGGTLVMQQQAIANEMKKLLAEK